MHCCIYEDGQAGNFLPLTYFRPLYDLRCGAFTLRQRAVAFLRPRRLSLHVRSYLRELVLEESPECEVGTISSDSCLFLNGRVLPDSRLVRILRKATPDTVFRSGTTVVAAHLGGRALNRVKAALAGDVLTDDLFDGITTVDVGASLLTIPLDAVYANESLLASDLAILGRAHRGKRGSAHRTAILVNRKQIMLGAGSIVGPGAVLDATDGPIHVGKGARIYPGAVVEGPCLIGDGSQVKIGAKIYGNTSIGPVCKVGGEVEHCILHSHVNKQHDGFLGHAYLGMWVNLGAGTTTSNLKNTYGTIRQTINGTLVDTGRMFAGLTAGDHTKTGINATIDTGTILGVSCNIYGTTLPPKLVPSFSWGSGSELTTYDPDRALDVAVRVMARRDVVASETYRRVFRTVFALTRNERTERT